MNARKIIRFLSVGLTILLASLANTEIVEQLHDQAMLDVVKKNPTGTVVFFNHSSDKPGLHSLDFSLLFLICQIVYWLLEIKIFQFCLLCHTFFCNFRLIALKILPTSFIFCIVIFILHDASKLGSN